MEAFQRTLAIDVDRARGDQKLAHLRGARRLITGASKLELLSCG